MPTCLCAGNCRRYGSCFGGPLSTISSVIDRPYWNWPPISWSEVRDPDSWGATPMVEGDLYGEGETT